MREQIIQSIETGKIIAILRGVPLEHVLSTAHALYKGGIRHLEFTFDRSGVIPHAVTCASIERTAAEFAGSMFVGAGTVTEPEHVELARQAGARFLISPNTDVEIIRSTVRHGMISIPGALTPTEIMTAHAAGADFVKLFPAGTMGASYVKAVCAPISDVKILAVGGVTAENAAEFLRAGACGIGISGLLANLKWIAGGEFDKIEAAARSLVEAVHPAAAE